MSTTTSSGGSAGDKHFVDTVGAWTSTGTHNPQTTITVFFKDTNSVTGSKTDFNVWNNTGLAALTTELGYTPAKFFQFYKVVSLEYWLTDIDYGTMYDSEPQTWNVYMAPWLNSPYQASSTFLSITPNYLPGCVWKNFPAQSTGNENTGQQSSSSNSQMLYLQIHNPVFEMGVFQLGSGGFQGRQMNSTLLPTYTNEGVDKTEWGWILVRVRRQSGNTRVPDPIYLEGQFRVTYAFKGLRCTKTSALYDYLPTDEELQRTLHFNVPNELSHHGRQREIHNVVSDIKKRKPERTIHELRNENIDNKSSDGTERAIRIRI